MCHTCQDVKVVKKSWASNNYVIYNDAHMWWRKIVKAQIISMNIVAMDLKKEVFMFLIICLYFRSYVWCL
jgi:hypothetical protein